MTPLLIAAVILGPVAGFVAGAWRERRRLRKAVQAARSKAIAEQIEHARARYAVTGGPRRVAAPGNAFDVPHLGPVRAGERDA